MKYVAIEQDKVLSTLEAYPQDKDILFRPDNLDACSDIPFKNPSDKCGSILAAWRDLRTSSGAKISEGESCRSVTREKNDRYFKIKTQKRENNEQRTYRALRVILALGLRGTPLTLGGPGKTLKRETEDRVQYKLSKPDDFKDKRMLIVGGGNSAVEAALALANQCKPNDDIGDGERSQISLAVRSGFTNDLAFTSKQKLYQYIDKGEIELYWDTTVTEICDGAVVLKNQRTHEEAVVPNDYILALIGGDFPTRFLEKIGITIPQEARKKSRLKQALSWITSFLKRGLDRLSASSRCPNS